MQYIDPAWVLYLYRPEALSAVRSQRTADRCGSDGRVQTLWPSEADQRGLHSAIQLTLQHTPKC